MMLEKSCDLIVTRMVALNLINDSDRKKYLYHLQVIIEFIIGHLLILMLSAILGCFSRVFVFLLAFDLLRSCSSGFHCKTNWGCFLFSSLVCSSVAIFETLSIDNWSIYQVVVAISMVIVIIIGAINHPDMSWSTEEFLKAKKHSRIIALVVGLVFLVMNMLCENKAISYCIGMGIIQCAVSLLLAKVTMRGGESNEES